MQKLQLIILCTGLSFATLSYAIDEIPRAPVGVCEKPVAVETQAPATAQASPIALVSGDSANNPGNSPELIDPPNADSDPGPDDPPADPVPVDPSDGLDVDELVAVALNQHPTLRQAQAAVDKAKGLQIQSSRKLNPTVGYMASEVGNEGRLGQQGVFVEQTFIRGNKLHLNSHIYGAEIDRMNHAVRVQSLRVARRVRRRYFELVYSRRRVQVLNRLLTVSENNLSIVRNRFEADDVSKTEVLTAQLEMQEIALSIRRAEIASTAAAQTLATAMGLQQYDLSSAVSPPSNPPTELTRESVWSELNAASPELAMARANIQKADWAIRRARAQPIGDVATQFSVQYDDSTKHTVAGIQVGVAIPVHDHNCGGIQAMQADYARACSDEQRLRLSLKERFITAFSQYEQAVESRATSANEMLPIARDNLELTTRLYDAGEADFAELLIAQRLYLKISLALLDADSRLWGIVTAFDQLLVADSSDAPPNADASDAATR